MILSNLLKQGVNVKVNRGGERMPVEPKTRDKIIELRLKGVYETKVVEQLGVSRTKIQAVMREYREKNDV